MNLKKLEKLHPSLPNLTQEMQKNQLDRREFLRTSTLLGLSASAAYMLAGIKPGQQFPGGSAFAVDKPKRGGSLRIAMPVQEMADPSTYAWIEKSNIARFMVEHLTHTGIDNITRPYLATRWEASEDLKTWTFHLKQGLTWNNGDAFGADDVVAAILRWLDPEIGSSNLGLFDALVEEYDTGKTDKDGKPVMGKRGIANAIEKVNDHAVRLNLKQAALAMPENFYNYPTAITHRGFGIDYEADLSEHPIGTGAFRLTEFNVGEKAILKRDRDWWAGDFYLDEIIYTDYGSDPQASLNALEAKQVDMIYQVDVNNVNQLKAMNHIKLYTVPTAQTSIMRMQSKTKPFDDIRVRKAIQACSDPAATLDIAYFGYGVLAEDHHVAPLHPEYFQLPQRDHPDIGKAKQLLDEAGYPNGLDLEIAVGDTQGPFETAICEAFREQLAPAGIRLKINRLPTSQYWEIWNTAPFGLTFWTHRPLGTMVLSLAYRPGVPWNETEYDNPKFEKALNKAESLVDVEKRRAAMEEVQKIIQDDAIMVQPFWRSIFKAADKRVKNFKGHPTQYHQFDTVWLDDA